MIYTNINDCIMIMKELSERKLATESKIKYEYKIQLAFRKNVLASIL